MEYAFQNQLAGMRRRQVLVDTTLGIANILGFAALFLAVEMLADWGIDWPWAEGAGFAWIVRAALLAVMLAAIGWIAWTWIVQPTLYGGDEESLALAVERRETDLGGRLIAAVQLSRPEALAAGASPTLVQALIVETEMMSANRDFARAVSVDELVQRGGIVLLILLVFAALFALARPVSGILLGRALLSNEPVPRRTQVTVLTGDTLVLRGDSVTITAEAQGVKPSAGTLLIQDPAGSHTFVLEADPQTPGRYWRRVDDVVVPFDYRVRLNDGGSATFHIDVAERPCVDSFNCVQIFPPYIGLPDTPHLPGDLALVIGSRLIVNVVATKPLASPAGGEHGAGNYIHLVGSEVVFPLDVDGNDPTHATNGRTEGSPGIPLPPGTTGMSIHLVDRTGLQTSNPIVYRIDLLPDEPPKVQITSGGTEEQFVTRTAVLHVSFSATDDFGLGSLALHYSVSGGRVQQIPLALPPGHPKAFSGNFDFSLGSVTIPAPQNPDDKPTIQYWFYAEDLNTVSTADHKPGHGESDRHNLRVVTDAEKRQELMGRFSNIISDQLNSVTTEQQGVSSRVGQIIVNKAGEPVTQPAP
jgi:hypothetical protein